MVYNLLDGVLHRFLHQVVEAHILVKVLCAEVLRLILVGGIGLSALREVYVEGLFSVLVRLDARAHVVVVVQFLQLRLLLVLHLVVVLLFSLIDFFLFNNDLLEIFVNFEHVQIKLLREQFAVLYLHIDAVDLDEGENTDDIIFDLLDLHDVVEEYNVSSHHNCHVDGEEYQYPH